MNDSDIGYDFEWNQKPDLTKHIGWVRVHPNGKAERFETWEETLHSSGGSLMSEEYYQTNYKHLNIKTL
jgi:hypothetical protein